MSPSSTDVLAALDRAVQQLPRLTVIDHPHCDGFAWLTDPETHTAYIRQADACTWAASLLDALDDLAARTGMEATTYPPLRLILGGGEGEHQHDLRTGTDHART